MGTSKLMILVPLFDLTSLGRNCGRRCRDFRSAALVTNGMAKCCRQPCFGGL